MIWEPCGPYAGASPARRAARCQRRKPLRGFRHLMILLIEVMGLGRCIMGSDSVLGGAAMRRSFAIRWVATLMAVSLVTMPVFGTPAGKRDEGATDGRLPQTVHPDVKAGSEADVNAIGHRDVGKGLDFYSLEKEIGLGKQLAQQVDREAKFINDPEVNAYVNQVGQNLVRNSDARVPFTIKVIDSDVVNAFALPGGFFYVNSGVILHADTEAELAGVMAHEIAHVCARHGTKEQTKGDIVQMASIPAMIFIPYSWAGYAMYQGMNFAIPLAFLRFSRHDEAEADYLGVQYMYKAGYDPNALVLFFEKIEADEKKQPGTIPKVFASHPPTPDRIEAIQKEIATILPARDEYIVSTSEFDQVKSRLQKIENNLQVKDSNAPTLRKHTGQDKGGSTDDSGRPTLNRRPQDQQP
jgi:predicted Zn-dependent protease